MLSSNLWGGSFEMHDDDNRDRNTKVDDNLDRGALTNQQQLDQAQQSWLLGPKENKRKKYMDFGCVVCSRQAVKWSFWTIVLAFVVIALPTIIVKNWPNHKVHPTPPDQYHVALTKALKFFDAQMSGRLPKNHNISWRGPSGLKDGVKDVKGGLVGGYYDAGDNIKFSFPMAFSMSMLSWSVIEYSHKYKSIGEYDHIRDIIKWGTDYLLLTFNSSATNIDKIYSQVGVGRSDSTLPDDHNCWQRPEDMNYDRPVQTTTAGCDLASEMASALASASIVFIDDRKYSQKLIKGATALFAFGRDFTKRSTYSTGKPDIEQFYKSSGYWDEFMWGSAWMYYATGNSSYLSLATNPGIPQNANASLRTADMGVLSWDNKLPAAELLLTRMRIFLSPGYPYEDMLRSYQNLTSLNMCSYLKKYNVYNFTKGGLIQLNHGGPQNLQYVVNAAFIASLFVDYMNATGVPGWYCGTQYTGADELHKFATSQVDYILGANPSKMSYVVGYGEKFPKHVHHRGASIPLDGHQYTCKEGFKWRDTKNSNPHNLTGAMVGGPDRSDKFQDFRRNYNFTEPTLAGNAGLVAALVSLTTTGGSIVDKNTMFSGVPPLSPTPPPPPPPWKP
ncbi:hypothetical protein C5167_030178 [Papaver somniferum]|uniref:endoglucanase 12-like n=1 Tax=Papaver somniferum TaxID=3469 RepID=UPI000E6F6022|nr:endoglucanase 12-like [Papaver somniferum]RZC86832.1 hypothetical protein C5167_030178 [Papaver somniferum]